MENEKKLYSHIAQGNKMKDNEMKDNIIEDNKVKEKELYSKVCVTAGIRFVVDEAKEESVGLDVNDKFTCNLATILARDEEVVAVKLTVFPDRCKVYISKNHNWLPKDEIYINKIEKCLKNISKNHLSFEEVLKSNDAKALYAAIMTYCSAKLESRFEKLKRDIVANRYNSYISSFTVFASINVDNIDNIGKMDLYKISLSCCEYYFTIKDPTVLPKYFLGHLKKVGSYFRSFMDIVECAYNAKYKDYFSNMKLHRLDPITTNQYVFSWKNIIQQFIPDPKNYENFKKACLKNYVMAKRLSLIYGDNIDTRLDLENINKHVYLHAEMNILTDIINQRNKSRAFIAVSKRCCYLCELYIEFARKQGYNIIISGSHKKIYDGWKLPVPNINANFINKSLLYMLENLDGIIMNETKKHISLLARSDSEAKSGSDNHIEQKKAFFKIYKEF